MPVKIQHKDTNQISIVSITDWNSAKIFRPNYNVLSQTDIVHVKMVNPRIATGRQDMGLWEKSFYMEQIMQYPNLYFSEPIEDIFNEEIRPESQGFTRLDKGNLLPTNTPQQYEIKSRKNQIISKYKDNPWFINIISGLIVVIILWFLGFIFNINYRAIFKWMESFSKF